MLRLGIIADAPGAGDRRADDLRRRREDIAHRLDQADQAQHAPIFRQEGVQIDIGFARIDLLAEIIVGAGLVDPIEQEIGDRLFVDVELAGDAERAMLDVRTPGAERYRGGGRGGDQLALGRVAEPAVHPLVELHEGADLGEAELELDGEVGGDRAAVGRPESELLLGRGDGVGRDQSGLGEAGDEPLQLLALERLVDMGDGDADLDRPHLIDCARGRSGGGQSEGVDEAHLALLGAGLEPPLEAAAGVDLDLAVGVDHHRGFAVERDAARFAEAEGDQLEAAGAGATGGEFDVRVLAEREAWHRHALAVDHVEQQLLQRLDVAPADLLEQAGCFDGGRRRRCRRSSLLRPTSTIPRA